MNYHKIEIIAMYKSQKGNKNRVKVDARKNHLQTAIQLNLMMLTCFCFE